MTERAFSRRLFLGGTLSLALASTVRTRTEVPIIWGDGVHDDAPGLNALFRGDAVRVLRGRAVEGERPFIADAKLLLGSTVYAKRDHIIMESCHVTAAPGFEGDYMLSVQGGHCRFNRLFIDGRYLPPRHTVTGIRDILVRRPIQLVGA